MEGSKFFQVSKWHIVGSLLKTETKEAAGKGRLGGGGG